MGRGMEKWGRTGRELFKSNPMGFEYNHII